MHAFMETPVGVLKITEKEGFITSIEYFKGKKSDSETSDILIEAIKQLEEYFSGDREEFELPLKPVGTDFQIQVWNELINIDYGSTCSYKDLAIAIENPKAVRAVGGANNKNPIPIIIPCHRVVGGDGSLTGYASGLEIKSWLLKHESRI